MKIYRITIRADKYPMDYNVNASNWGTAIARAVREWRTDKGKGSRATKLSITALKSGDLLQANGDKIVK